MLTKLGRLEIAHVILRRRNACIVDQAAEDRWTARTGGLMVDGGSQRRCLC